MSCQSVKKQFNYNQRYVGEAGMCGYPTFWKFAIWGRKKEGFEYLGENNKDMVGSEQILGIVYPRIALILFFVIKSGFLFFRNLNELKKK